VNAIGQLQLGFTPTPFEKAAVALGRQTVREQQANKEEEYPAEKPQVFV
jgi:hypothetical protein